MAVKYFTPLSFILLLAFSTIAISADYCIYNLLIQTGSMQGAGTDSTIKVQMDDTYENSLQIQNIESWGIMEPGHNYFEKGNLDFFSGRAPCYSFCALNLISDGTGSYPAWYVSYVELTTTGVHGCSRQKFEVEQWLVSEETLSNLTAYRNNCPSGALHDSEDRSSTASI